MYDYMHVWHAYLYLGRWLFLCIRTPAWEESMLHGVHVGPLVVGTPPRTEGPLKIPTVNSGRLNNYSGYVPCHAFGLRAAMWLYGMDLRRAAFVMGTP